MKLHLHAIFVIVFFILSIIVGTYAYHSIEGWRYLDSTYFLVITATTIGYGDITPQTDLGKIITIFYSFVGIASVLYLVSLINNHIFEKKFNKHLKK
jgi:voltage-gated potassium channel Kch